MTAIAVATTSVIYLLFHGAKVAGVYRNVMVTIDGRYFLKKPRLYELPILIDVAFTACLIEFVYESVVINKMVHFSNLTI